MVEQHPSHILEGSDRVVRALSCALPFQSLYTKSNMRPLNHAYIICTISNSQRDRRPQSPVAFDEFYGLRFLRRRTPVNDHRRTFRHNLRKKRRLCRGTKYQWHQRSTQYQPIRAMLVAHMALDELEVVVIHIFLDEVQGL